jgi:hypothetical protein
MSSFETATDKPLIAGLLEFFATYVFIVAMNHEGGGPYSDSEMALFETLWVFTTGFFTRLELFEIPMNFLPDEPVLLKSSLELLKTLMMHHHFLNQALTQEFVRILIRNSYICSRAGSLSAFFRIIELFLTEERSNEFFTPQLFQRITQLATRACLLHPSRVNPFRVLAHMDHRYWRNLYESGLVHGCLEIADQLSFDTQRSLCLWLMELMLEADNEVRIEIACREWFELVLRLMHTDEPELIIHIGSVLVQLHADNPESMEALFGENEFPSLIGTLLEELDDPESLAALGNVQVRLFSDGCRIESV